MHRIFFVGALVSLAACGSSSDNTTGGTDTGTCTAATATAVTSDIDLKAYAFSPTCVSVAKGTAITFTNSDKVSHTVTTKSGQVETFDSNDLAPSATYAHTFSTAGSINIYCKYHTYMTLTVIVQ